MDERQAGSARDAQTQRSEDVENACRSRKEGRRIELIEERLLVRSFGRATVGGQKRKDYQTFRGAGAGEGGEWQQGARRAEVNPTMVVDDPEINTPRQRRAG